MPDRNDYTAGGQRGRERRGQWDDEPERGGEGRREPAPSQYGARSGRGARESNYGTPSSGRAAGTSGGDGFGRGDYGYGDRPGFDGGRSEGTGRRDANPNEEWRGYGGGRGDQQGSGAYESYGERPPYGGGQSQRGGSSEPPQYGQHRGKGPKGYQRSDERLRELICERLREDPEIDPSEVTIDVSGARVILEGSVDSRRTKNAIEDIVEQFDVTDVENNLRVLRVAGGGLEN